MPEVLTRTTTVVSVRGLRGDKPGLDPNLLYVGRRSPWTGWDESDWSNPFWQLRSGDVGIDFTRVPREWWSEVCSLFLDGEQPATLGCADLYDLWLDTQPDLLHRLPELAGRSLGCWCGTWSPGDPPIGCHAYLLAVRVNALVDTSREGEPPCLNRLR